MNTSVAKCVSIGALVLLLASNAFAIHCYVCNSHYNGTDCVSAEKIKDSENFLVDCSSLEGGEKYSYCRKLIQEVPTSRGLELRVIRQCGYYNTTSHGCQKVGVTDGGEQYMCTCAEDGCNSSPSLRPALALVIVALVGIFI